MPRTVTCLEMGCILAEQGALPGPEPGPGCEAAILRQSFGPSRSGLATGPLAASEAPSHYNKTYLNGDT